MIKLDKPDFDLFTLFEMTPDLVCIAGKDGFFRNVNPAVIDKLGYSREELFAVPISTFIHPDDKEITSQSRGELLQGQNLLNFQNRYLTKQGDIVWLEWTSVYVPDKEVVFAIAKDVTQRKIMEKKAEEESRKFKNLAAYFKTSIEEDRKYFATELHEQLAQLAASLKMDLEWIGKDSSNLTAFSKNRLAQAVTVSGLMVSTIRKISFTISPHMLDDFGLNTTLEWHCREFSLLAGIPCSFEANYDEASLTKEMKIDFFRICQESLSNVMDHAGATSVQIIIENKEENITLSIIDNGKGFDTAQQQSLSGLTAIRERALSIDGLFTITSHPGNGTRISVTVKKNYTSTPHH
jgi:PAS domain S-box-containing protein